MLKSICRNRKGQRVTSHKPDHKNQHTNITGCPQKLWLTSYFCEAEGTCPNPALVELLFIYLFSYSIYIPPFCLLKEVPKAAKDISWDGLCQKVNGDLNAHLNVYQSKEMQHIPGVSAGLRLPVASRHRHFVGRCPTSPQAHKAAPWGARLCWRNKPFAAGKNTPYSPLHAHHGEGLPSHAAEETLCAQRGL